MDKAVRTIIRSLADCHAVTSGEPSTFSSLAVSGGILRRYLDNSAVLKLGTDNDATPPSPAVVSPNARTRGTIISARCPVAAGAGTTVKVSPLARPSRITPTEPVAYGEIKDTLRTCADSWVTRMPFALKLSASLMGHGFASADRKVTNAPCPSVTRTIGGVAPGERSSRNSETTAFGCGFLLRFSYQARSRSSNSLLRRRTSEGENGETRSCTSCTRSNSTTGEGIC